MKPLILIFNRHYLPGYRAGGPIRSIVNVIDQLNADFNFHVVTADRDFGDTKPYSNISPREWKKVGSAHVYYVNADDVRREELAHLVNEIHPDLIYLNSFFDPWFTQRTLIARWCNEIGNIPIILAPRGEFSLGALRIKRLKKWMYLKLAKLIGLYKGVIWQASSEIEREDIERQLGRATVVVARNLSPAVNVSLAGRTRLKKIDEPLRLCFYSRISPKKNLDFALRALAKVTTPIIFTIYGPKEDESYWAACEALISILPKNIQLCLGGPLQPSAVKETLSQHDLFFLPTRGENYGHVIHEALEAGLPVLLSDQTPWRDVVERQIGWTHSLDSTAPFVEVIEDCSRWGSEKWAATSNAAIKYAHEKAVDALAVEQNRKLFADAISGAAEKRITERRKVS